MIALPATFFSDCNFSIVIAVVAGRIPFLVSPLSFATSAVVGESKMLKYTRLGDHAKTPWPNS